MHPVVNSTGRHDRGRDHPQRAEPRQRLGQQNGGQGGRTGVSTRETLRRRSPYLVGPVLEHRRPLSFHDVLEHTVDDDRLDAEGNGEAKGVTSPGRPEQCHEATDAVPEQGIVGRLTGDVEHEVGRPAAAEGVEGLVDRFVEGSYGFSQADSVEIDRRPRPLGAAWLRRTFGRSGTRPRSRRAPRSISVCR